MNKTGIKLSITLPTKNKEVFRKIVDVSKKNMAHDKQDVLFKKSSFLDVSTTLLLHCF